MLITLRTSPPRRARPGASTESPGRRRQDASPSSTSAVLHDVRNRHDHGGIRVDTKTARDSDKPPSGVARRAHLVPALKSVPLSRRTAFRSQGISDDGNGAGVVVTASDRLHGRCASAWHSRDARRGTASRRQRQRPEMVGGVRRAREHRGRRNGCLAQHRRLTCHRSSCPEPARTRSSRCVLNGARDRGLWNAPPHAQARSALVLPNGSNWLQAPTRWTASTSADRRIGIVSFWPHRHGATPPPAASWSSSDGGTWTKSTGPPTI